ncbi:MAG: M24 family metallopeptidase [Chloroflexi bacterium]|nr:M24 family metallopeptidase [Chloroflexota bacterium]
MADRVPLRLAKLRSTLLGKGLEAILISCPENRRYLSSFTGSSGYLIISGSSALLATDSRYFEQVKRESPHFELFQLKGYGPKWLLDAASQINVKRIAVEASHLPLASYRQFVDAASEASSGLQLVPETGIVESLRAVKDAEELAAIADAARLVHKGLKYISNIARPGVTENELAWQLEKALRENGSESMPFDIMVASGPNAALPHAHPTERRIGVGEPVLIDVGARLRGYCSDVTRTLCLGESDKKFRKIYDCVLGSQLTAIATMEAGMTGGQVDGLGRVVINEAGYGECFGHGLGHGVGLEVHEAPRVGLSSDDSMMDGMVFTVEPGVYIPGWGGVRIEDTVVMEAGRARVLN